MNYIEFPKLGIHLDINPRAVSNLFGTNISFMVWHYNCSCNYGYPLASYET